MDAHWREFVLAGQGEGELSVLHKGQAHAVGRMDGIDLIATHGLLLQFLRQFVDIDRPDVNQTIGFQLIEIERCVHVSTPY